MPGAQNATARPRTSSVVTTRVVSAGRRSGSWRGRSGIRRAGIAPKSWAIVRKVAATSVGRRCPPAVRYVVAVRTSLAVAAVLAIDLVGCGPRGGATATPSDRAATRGEMVEVRGPLGWLAVVPALIVGLVGLVMKGLGKVLAIVAWPLTVTYDWIERLYPRVLRLALKVRLLVLAAALGLGPVFVGGARMEDGVVQHELHVAGAEVHVEADRVVEQPGGAHAG